MRKYLRWPLFIVLAALLVSALVPAFSLWHSSRTAARAAGPQAAGPTLSTSVGNVPISQPFTVTGQGFAANETVNVTLEAPVGTTDFLGTLTCNSSGDCTGTMSAQIASPIPQGVYILTGVGATSGLTAKVPLGIEPAITLGENSSSPLEVGPGAQIVLDGESFNSNETVQIYLGTASGTLEGTSTTDSFGSLFFMFTAPTTLTPGRYFVTVVRSKQKPAAVTSQFHVIPPQMTSSPGVHSGQHLYLVLKGFQADEQVVISWNANGGQQLGTLTTSGVGSAINCAIRIGGGPCISAPSAPLGSYTLTATGASSGLHATSSLNVGPGIALSPAVAGIGSTITVNGGGFTPGEKVNVYFQTTSHGIVVATPDATGAFSVSLTVPKTYQQGASYYVHAVNTADTEHVRAQFYFTPPSISIGTAEDITVGSPVSLYGWGFMPSEAVDLYWNYQQTGQLKVATATADQNGSFTIRVNIPSDPDLSSINIGAIGQSSQFTATTTIFENPAILLHPAQGQPGTQIQIKGGGFGSKESVTISFDGTTVATVTSNVRGAINTSYVVPMNTPAGQVQVLARGQSSGVVVWAYFQVQ